MIVHVNGMPGVGKLTVSRLLQERAKADGIECYLVDNHLILDLITSFLPRGSKGYIDVFIQINELIFSFMDHIKNQDMVVFTNALAKELQEDLDRYDLFPKLAKDRDDIFIPVCLTCNIKENARRLQMDDRKTKGKLMDVDVLYPMVEEYSIYYDEKDMNGLELDTTDLSAEDAAELIYEHCQKFQ